MFYLIMLKKLIKNKFARRMLLLFGISSLLCSCGNLNIEEIANEGNLGYIDVASPINELIDEDVLSNLIERISYDLDNDSDSTEEYIKLLEDGPEYEIVNIKDSITYTLKRDNETISIRLIGIQKPENDLEETFCKGYMQTLLKEETLRLEFDEKTVDEDNNMLVYAYLKDGRMLNKVMLLNGITKLKNEQPNTKYEVEFMELYEVAVNDNVGIFERN